MSQGVLRDRGMAMALVEAAHNGDGDWTTWCEGLLEASRKLCISPLVNVGVGVRHEGHYQVLGAASAVRAVVDSFWRTASRYPAAAFDPFWRYPGYVGTIQDALQGRALDPELTRLNLMMGCNDIVGVVGIANEYSVSLGLPQTEVVRLSAEERRLLTQLALHLETGLKLRAEPSAPIAWIDTEGRVVHAQGALSHDSSSRALLSTHVKTVERSRARRHRQKADSVAMWQALVSGRWALVERGQNSNCRQYAVLAMPGERHLRALTALESRVVELSARGLTGKNVAYALGVSAGTVSKLLAHAAAKLGIPDRTRLVRLVACLLGVNPAEQVSAALTAAEKDVLKLIGLGWTNVAIARERKRSEHTVANQVAALLQKLQVPSRRALATTAAGTVSH